MKISVVGRQMNVYEDMKALIEKKLSKLDRYFANESQATVTMKCRNHGEKRLEITLLAGGTVFRSEVSAESFRDALDEAVSNIDRQIRKNKTKLQKRLRDNSFVQPQPDEFDDLEAEEISIIRQKTYSIRPMSPEDAVLEMNLSGHNFYVFIDSEHNCTSVVYKREDGGYGLMLPEKA